MVRIMIPKNNVVYIYIYGKNYAYKILALHQYILMLAKTATVIISHLSYTDRIYIVH